jgi:hypothetical protein
VDGFDSGNARAPLDHIYRIAGAKGSNRRRLEFCGEQCYSRRLESDLQWA